MRRSNWLDFEEWAAQGMPILGTTSSNAVKLYDAAITQFAGWYDDPVLGGLAQTLAKLEQADPNFVLGNAFILCMRMIGFTENYHYNHDLREKIDRLQRNAEEQRNRISIREYRHAQAVIRMSKSDWNGAAAIWEDILRDFPTDMHAVKMAFYMYFFTGQKQQQFDSMERVYPHFQCDSVVNANFTDGMYAFVLEETGQFVKAEKYARQGLLKSPRDGWTTHSLAHVYESGNRSTEGAAFMSETCKLWTASNLLACHNYWHFALFHLAADDEEGLDRAVHLLDNEVLPRVRSSQTTFSIGDASSLLFRLSLLDENDRNRRASTVTESSLCEKFNEVYSVAKQYLNRHILPFNDAQFVMACLGSGHRTQASDMLESFSASTYAETHPEVAAIFTQLITAMISFADEDYAKATDILLEIRASLHRIGGSDAQRDVFTQLLFVSALRSPNVAHRRMLTQLENECDRYRIKRKAPL